MTRPTRAQQIFTEHGVDLRTAAMQFSAEPDSAAALIVGAHTAGQALANATSMTATVPASFWDELKREGLIAAEAPVPKIPELV